jgi:alpha-glucuronidase
VIRVDGPSDAARSSAWPPNTTSESYALSRSTSSSYTVVGPSGAAVLYGTFTLLGLIRRESPALLSRSFASQSEPSSPLRVWDLWDNRDRSVERGYAGQSVFHYEELPALLPRYTDYARLLASVGINGIVWDNVNACGAENQYVAPYVQTATRS